MPRDGLSRIAAMLVTSLIGGGLASLVFAPRPAASAQGGAASITAEQVTLVDGNGRIRGVLSAEDERGMTSLALFDGAGQRRAVLATGADGAPTLELYDRAQALRVHAAIQGDAPIVVVNGADGRRAMLSTLTGGPALSFAEGERNLVQIGLGTSGTPGLEMVGPMGQQQLSLIVDGEGQPIVTFRDSNGRSRATVGVVQDATVINLADQTAARIVLGVAPDGSGSLTFLDENGPIYEVP
jgi:hypothetical protein